MNESEYLFHHSFSSSLDYFGISYVEEDDQAAWLDYEKKINKQISKGQWNFTFRVKFYPPEPSTMKEDVTRCVCVCVCVCVCARHSKYRTFFFSFS